MLNSSASECIPHSKQAQQVSAPDLRCRGNPVFIQSSTSLILDSNAAFAYEPSPGSMSCSCAATFLIRLKLSVPLTTEMLSRPAL